MRFIVPAVLLFVLVAVASVTAEQKCKKQVDCRRSPNCTRVGGSLVCRQHCMICRVCSGSSETRSGNPESGNFEYSSSGGASDDCASCSSEFSCHPGSSCENPAPCKVDL